MLAAISTYCWRFGNNVSVFCYYCTIANFH